MDYKLEVVVLPVAGVDRAKDIYSGPGWRLDAGLTGGGELAGARRRAEAAHGGYGKRPGHAGADWVGWSAQGMGDEQNAYAGSGAGA